MSTQYEMSDNEWHVVMGHDAWDSLREKHAEGKPLSEPAPEHNCINSPKWGVVLGATALAVAGAIVHVTSKKR